MTLTLLALSLTTAEAQVPTPVATASLLTVKEVIYPEGPPVRVDVPTQTITFNADRFNRLGFGDDINDAWHLVPGHSARTGRLADYGRTDIAVMLDGVVLRSEGRLAPIP